MKGPAAGCVLMALLASGCSSSRPEPEPPRLERLAREAATEGARQSSQEQWQASAAAWEIAARHYALLNDQAGDAVARHNLGQALRRLNRCDEAVSALEEAALINLSLDRREEWWRNQIALIQTERSCGATQEVARRFESLAAQNEFPANPLLRAFFDNEAGLWELANGRHADAVRKFEAALKEFESSNHRAGEAAARFNLALASEARSDWAAALEFWRAILPIYEMLGDPSGIAAALAGQGRALVRLERDLPEAETLLRRAARNWMLLDRAVAARAARIELIQALKLQGKSAEADSLRSALDAAP